MFIAILSDNPAARADFCKKIGKETGSGDITFYTSNFQGTIRTLLEPTLYPDKLQPLLYALSIADYIVLLADSPTPRIGELIVALGLLKKEKGILLSRTELPIKGTVLEKYEHLSSPEEAKQKILSLQAPPAEGELLALIDSAFQVKSVGNVMLGAVKSGSIKKRDKLVYLPSKTEIEVKSIQLNDKEVDEVPAGGRFGICYKGGPIERGILAPPSNSFNLATSIPGTLSKSPFYKSGLPKKIHAYTNLQFVEGTVSDSQLSLEKPLAFLGGKPILLVDPGNPKLRICGTFTPNRRGEFPPF